jgi:hypothetical protein
MATSSHVEASVANGSGMINSETSEKGEVPIGSLSTVKNIYKSPIHKSADPEDLNWSWVDKYPEDIKKAAENEESEGFAVVRRNVMSNDSRKNLEAHSIIVQSPWLKEALAEILADYPGVACDLQRLVFMAPFEPFVHRWAEFLKYMQRAELDATTKEHLAILHDILSYEIGDNIKAFEDYVLNGVISFQHLWMIFQPGCIVLSTHGGPMSAFELYETEYMEINHCNVLRLRCDCVDYGGNAFGRHQENINIPEFLGTKWITGLNAFPFEFYEDKHAVQKSLIERGQKFENLAGYHYMA